jgi:hypothetical protein
MRGVHPVAMPFERFTRRIQRSRGPAQLARGQIDFGFSDETPGARDGFFRSEGSRRASQKRFRSGEVAELRHRDAPKRKGRRIVAQGDPLQRA